MTQETITDSFSVCNDAHHSPRSFLFPHKTLSPFFFTNPRFPFFLSSDSVQATYAVPMHCMGCFDSVKQAVSTLPGFVSISPDLANELVTVTGTVAPSSVVRTIQSIGKDAIVRGTGAPGTAAVSILETFYQNVAFSSAASVKGLARIVAVSPSRALFDLTLSGVPPGTYYASIRKSGCLVDGPLSAGEEFQELGTITVEKNKKATGELDTFGQSYITRNVKIDEIIGRSVAVSKTPIPDKDSLIGVIARSAGVWQNDKTVCSCSGKTVWEERRDALSKGVL